MAASETAGGGAFSVVQAWQGERPGASAAFRGWQAFADASDCFEAQQADARVTRLWLVRRDGREWRFVAKLARRGGAWVEEG